MLWAIFTSSGVKSTSGVAGVQSKVDFECCGRYDLVFAHKTVGQVRGCSLEKATATAQLQRAAEYEHGIVMVDIRLMYSRKALLPEPKNAHGLAKDQ